MIQMYVEGHSAPGNLITYTVNFCYRTTKIKSLEENVATGQVHLKQNEVDQLQTVIKAAEVGGDRYPQGVGANLYADTPAMD